MTEILFRDGIDVIGGVGVHHRGDERVEHTRAWGDQLHKNQGADDLSRRLSQRAGDHGRGGGTHVGHAHETHWDARLSENHGSFDSLLVLTERSDSANE